MSGWLDASPLSFHFCWYDSNHFFAFKFLIMCLAPIAITSFSSLKREKHLAFPQVWYLEDPSCSEGKHFVKLRMSPRTCMASLLTGSLRTQVLLVVSQGPQLSLQDGRFSTSLRSPGDFLCVMIFFKKGGQRGASGRFQPNVVHLDSGWHLNLVALVYWMYQEVLYDSSIWE